MPPFGRMGSVRRGNSATLSVQDQKIVEETPVLTFVGAILALSVISVLVAVHSE